MLQTQRAHTHNHDHSPPPTTTNLCHQAYSYSICQQVRPPLVCGGRSHTHLSSGRPRLTQEERERHRTNGLCIACRKNDHFIAACPLHKPRHLAVHAASTPASASVSTPSGLRRRGPSGITKLKCLELPNQGDVLEGPRLESKAPACGESCSLGFGGLSNSIA